MLDETPDSGSGNQLNAVDELRSKAEALEQKLFEVQKQSEARLIRAELKAEAVRAGMIDLDGLKLLDMSSIRLNESGEVQDASAIMAQFRKAKPWLFNTTTSPSAIMTTPPTLSLRQKHATEMTMPEYAAARAALLKQRY